MGVVVRLIAESGNDVFTAKDSAVSTRSTPASIFAQFALEDLTPGVYLLRVEAQLSNGDSPTVVRETLITVVPQ